MKTSLNNILHIENYLKGKLSSRDRLLFEAELFLNPVLRAEVRAQKKTYFLLNMYHRKMLKKEMEEIHRQIFGNPEKLTFQQHIYQLFNPEKR